MREALGRQSVRMATPDPQTGGLRPELENLKSEIHDAGPALGTDEVAAASLPRRSESGSVQDKTRLPILTVPVRHVVGRQEDPSHSAGIAMQSLERTNAQLTEALAAMTEQFEDRLREADLEKLRLSETTPRDAGSQEAGRHRVEELEGRLTVSEQAREESLVENGRLLAMLADLEIAVRKSAARAVELEMRLAERDPLVKVAQTAPLSQAEPTLAPNQESEARQASEAFRISNTVIAGNDALRASITKLGWDVARLFAAQRSPPRQGAAPSSLTSERNGAGAPHDPANDKRSQFADASAPSHAADR